MRTLMMLCTGVAMILPGLAAAQTGNVEARVGRLESEMRAVQRKVFPGGAGQLVQPDIVAPTASPEVSGAPVSSPVVDLAARVSSLEQQIATLTGQSEQNGFQLRQLREQFDAYKASTDARLAALAPAPAATAPAIGGPVGGDDPAPIASAAPSRPIAGSRPAAGGAPAAADRADKLAAIKRPAKGGDQAEEQYLYGYRLWQAGLYPEAQAQLKKTVADFPASRRASYAQNLLGRSYLDDGKPSLASMAFYDNYKKMPDGERAPDSLLYLGQALVKLDKPADACRVYGELTDVYGAKMTAAFKADLARGRTAAKCK
ncbi:tetratricopeptide repeat protein [Sphingomonas sp. 1P08PE]|uniref:tetratricopeptide repeat protein n=1 Tax=Sphingomonas sp. 1P08PE TaxID=554122 RepID=UPI0039A205A2